MGSDNDRQDALNLPNLISVCRLLAVPLIVYLIATHEYGFAFWAFVAAGISDGVDGFIAKNFHQVSELGRYLDPLADKALLVAIYVAFGVQAELPLWLVFAVVSRDIFILLAVTLSWMMSHPVKVRPLMISKANTTAQILFAGAVLADLAFSLEIAYLLQLLAFVVAALTALSALAYFLVWVQHMAGGADDRGDDAGRA